MANHTVEERLKRLWQQTQQAWANRYLPNPPPNYHTGFADGMIRACATMTDTTMADVQARLQERERGRAT